jgi:hypothetical protein
MYISTRIPQKENITSGLMASALPFITAEKWQCTVVYCTCFKNVDNICIQPKVKTIKLVPLHTMEAIGGRRLTKLRMPESTKCWRYTEHLSLRDKKWLSSMYSLPLSAKDWHKISIWTYHHLLCLVLQYGYIANCSNRELLQCEDCALLDDCILPEHILQASSLLVHD